MHANFNAIIALVVSFCESCKFLYRGIRVHACITPIINETIINALNAHLTVKTQKTTDKSR